MNRLRVLRIFRFYCWLNVRSNTVNLASEFGYRYYRNAIIEHHVSDWTVFDSRLGILT